MTTLEWVELSLYVNAALWSVMVLVAIVDRIVHPPLRPRMAAQLPQSPRVSIVVPARNEESNLAKCIPSIVAQDYPDWELYIVDDQSTDRTADVVEGYAKQDPRIHLIRGEPLPQGWVGKGWALFQGHRRANGEWIVLLDADTELRPWALSSCVGFAHERGFDFLNPTPLFVNRAWWEKTLQPLLWSFVTLRFPAIVVNTSWIPENMAFGPFLLIRKSVYDAVGGHKQVCNDILEDVALSRLVKDAGYRTYVVAGHKIFSIRMYETFRALLEGWIKTAYGAMNYSLFWMTLAVLGVFYTALWPFCTLAASLLIPAIAADGESSAILLRASLCAIGALFLRRAVDVARFRLSGLSLLLHPFGMLVVQYMQIAATWKYYFSSITWKGRAYYADKEKGGLHA